MPTNHDPAWLEQLHETLVEALRSNDLAALGACFAEHAVLLPPGRATIPGREGIVAYWKGAERIQDLVFEATDTKAFGDNALREAGNLLITTRGEGRDTFNVACKYVTLWLNADGGWKIDSMAWSRATAGGGRRGPRGRQGGRRRQGGGGGGGEGGGGRRRQGGGGGRQGGGGGRQGGGRGRQGGED